MMYIVRNKNHHPDQGFTLIELLVSLVIFGLLASIVVYSFGLSFRLVGHIGSPYAEETQALSRLRDSIASMFFYVGIRENLMYRQKEFYEVFYGTPGELTFVSMQPLKVAAPALTRLYLDDGSLLLAETPLYSKEFDYLQPSFNGREPQAVLLLDDVEDLRLQYFFDKEEHEELIERLPQAVRVTIRRNSTDAEYFIKVGSNFTSKKFQVEQLYDPF